ncbi:Glyoxylase, beta-lactamase superfamily II [Thalassobacillus cyri]|uniref:Glyoxylase, beta-lactamase superfamily II n=1 Tax=Thalassobacillus cyri TaxID=571932 RepID=A0A1H3ZFL0_9BACI|nr:MBL fold metallo-hydrolase [Thalassobacillus cyri]SEA22134.1 Glyoxylase, beta-lactamase superfamily II [Thalassobacillus cyri]
MYDSKTRTYKYYPITVTLSEMNPLKTVNFYLLSYDDQLILYDAGWDGNQYWQALQHTLKENGFNLNDLTGIVISHNHVDHCGLVNQIVEKHDVPVYSHEKAIPRLKRDPDFLQMRIGFYEDLYERFDCGERGKWQVDYLIESFYKNRDAAIIPPIKSIEDAPLQNLEVFHFPGHAPDQIGLWDEENHILLGADVLIQHISSNALVEPDKKGRRLPTVHQSVQSLNKIASLPVDLVYSGHGVPIENPHALIAKRLRRIDEKGNKIISLIKNGASTGSEIAKTYYGNTYKQQFSLVMSEIIGQLDYLEHQEIVTKTVENGVFRYKVIGG